MSSIADKKRVDPRQQVQEVIDRGVEKLDDIFEMLLDEAMGVYFSVSPHIPARDKPKKSKCDPVGLADVVERVCRTCKQPILKEPRELWEVWKTRRDGSMLRFLYDQLAGKSKIRETEKVDPEIIVVFGDIKSVEEQVPCGEPVSAAAGQRSEGSLPRTVPDARADPFAGILDDDDEEIGI